MKHTPGPWVAKEAWGKSMDDPGPTRFCFVEINKVDGNYIPVASTNSARSVGAQRADAFLIAAAPEMLEALELTSKMLEAQCGCEMDGETAVRCDYHRGLSDDVADVIRKAKGQS